MAVAVLIAGVLEAAHERGMFDASDARPRNEIIKEFGGSMEKWGPVR